MRMTMRIWTMLLLAGLAGLAPRAHAVSVFVGDHVLLPDTAGQVVPIYVSGGQAVQGLNFYAQIADGGPGLGGLIGGPAITIADIITGTIFQGNNWEGQDDPGSFAQLASRTTTTESGTVPASGLLATLIIDTTGFHGGTWPLLLSGTLNGTTDFADERIPVSITNGSISIVVPEPAFASLLLASGMMLAAARPRRRRKACEVGRV